ncbi:ataxin-2-like isoform X2 [Acipenser ruthenus]|uniref:ataxin-2-like isoform X2 n=1 Tax=Acipenser ruthenus TaxID=7906 RepID=UPI001560EAAC|nr:ataxin-2-like isoform X2 [Acipenser ruthenus]
MSMKQAGGNRKPGNSSSGGPAAASGAGGSGGSGGRQNMGRGRNSGKGPPSATIPFDGVYANMRMVHVLTSVVGTKCELKVKNGVIYEGVFKTYSPKCDLVLDAAHRKSPDGGLCPKREDILESIIFKASDVVVVQFKDVDLNYARKVSSETDTFTEPTVNARINGEHKDKDLEPWDSGENVIEDLEALETDVSNGWDPNDMFKFNEENYGVKSTYDSSLSSYTVALERDTSEEFLKREARAAQLADEIESSASYKARVAVENDDRTEEDKYTAVARNSEREGHSMNSRENKYIPPGQRNRDGMSWGTGRQNSPRMAQPGSGPPPPRTGAHNSDYSPSSGADQRVVNGGVPWPSPCPSPSSRPPSRYQSAPTSLPPRAATPTRPPSRPPSRPSRPPSRPSAHGAPAPFSTMPKRMSTEGPPRMSPKTQRTPRGHRGSTGRVGMGVEFIPHNAPAEVSPPPAPRSSPSGGTWSAVVSGGSSSRLSPKVHRPRSPRQNSIGSASSGSSLPSPQAGTVPVESVAMPVSAVSPTAASPASNRAVTPSAEAKESRLQEPRQNSPAASKENIKPSETSPSFPRPANKGASSVAPDHRQQIDNLKKFSEDFRLQPSSNPDPIFDQMISQPRDPAEKSRESHLDKTAETSSKESASEDGSAPNTTGSSKPSSPSTSPSTECSSEQKRGPDVTSQGVQTSGPGNKLDKDDNKDTTLEQVRKSTLNPNAKEFNPRSFSAQPKPATTPTPPRPQGQPSPSIVVQQHPTMYSPTVCFPQMYPLPVSPGVQKSIVWKPTAMYHVPVTHMPVNQTKPYRAGKVPNMPQQRPDQHHPQGTPTMIHPATAAGPPIVAPNPAYSAQYVTYSPQQFANQPLVQQVPHYQSQPPHVYSPVMQSNGRMMAPPTHGQPGLVSSSTTQYGAAEQTHTMYVSQGPIPQQYTHPNATLHHHPQHPQPSATPTGQQQGQHAGSHPAPSPVQHAQHQAAQALHLGNPQQQPIYSTLTPTPPSMTPGPNPQSPQTSFPSAQQAVYIHPQQVQHGYNPSHMAHVPQAHVQSGMVPPHHATPTHPPMMLMATQPPGGPQPPIPQNALPPIPVSSTTHFSYMAHPTVQAHHQQQL